ncbi:MAG: hypothetical protein ACLR1G_04745 [Alistipes indistinctus]|jgi:lipoprotein
MKKLIIVLGICLLGFGCDKVENDDDQIRQNEINRQFIGLWKYAVPHDKNTEPYYGFTVNFKFISYYIFAGEKHNNKSNGKSYRFEDGPMHSKYKIYKLIIDNQPICCQYISNDTLYRIGTLSQTAIEQWVGNKDYAYKRTSESMY